MDRLEGSTVEFNITVDEFFFCFYFYLRCKQESGSGKDR